MLVLSNKKQQLSSLYDVSTDSCVYALSSMKDSADYSIGFASNTYNRISQHQEGILGNRVTESVHRQLLCAYDICDIAYGGVLFLHQFITIS